ncbi:MAG: glycosyltransferase [Anaerolineales bacterium]|nr:glycosyltransferase [Anaerolineales bacterium]
MRILHVYKDYAPILGGIENHIRALAEAQVRNGHDVTVLVTNPRGRETVEEKLNGVRVIKAGRWATVASTPLSPSFSDWLKKLQPEITHLQAPYPLGELAQWFNGRGRPYLISYQADVNRPVQKLIMLAYGPLFRRILRGAARVLITNPPFAANSPHLRPVKDKLALVPIGVDVSRFSPRPAPATTPPTLLFVGQLRHYKGVDDLLRALKHLDTNVQLLIAGDGPQRAHWKVLTHELGLRERVNFLGNVPDAELPALYQRASVFVLPSTSRAESYGTVLVEAMASGLPCVTTEIGSGNSFVVQNEQTGLVVPPHAPPALAATLQRLLKDANLCEKLGQAGRARAVAEFSVETMVRRVEKIYGEVLSGA